MCEKQLSKKVNFCLPTPMTQCQTIKADFAEVWNGQTVKPLSFLWDEQHPLKDIHMCVFSFLKIYAELMQNHEL